VTNADVATTTYTYDANGNLAQAGGWNYVWDYLNRMLASGYNNSTTTYAYDPSDARVLQTSTTSTTFYPNKFYSFSSTLAGGTTYATSTNYIWNGDTLLATVDQPMINGTATGTPITRYIHPDHLGSTNVVTDASGTVAQLLDYYPYGATRISSNTYPTNEKRQYIGQLYDQGTGLNYLQARYYDSARGQFVNEDPVFWGDPKDQNLQNPQSLNSYSYASDNPISNKDPSGKFTATASLLLAALVAVLYVAFVMLSNPHFQQAATHAINSVPTPSAIVQPHTPSTAPSSNPSGPSSGGITTFPQPAAPSSGFSITPINSPTWSSINFSQDNSSTGDADKATPNINNPSDKIQKQMGKRGWTPEQIEEAIQNGQQVSSQNKANGNPATRYINPTTGQSVVVDDVTGEIIHVGGPGFQYGPESGDLTK
jgi:RHS repeat-associated protein